MVGEEHDKAIKFWKNCALIQKAMAVQTILAMDTYATQRHKADAKRMEEIAARLERDKITFGMNAL